MGDKGTKELAKKSVFVRTYVTDALPLKDD